MLAAPHAHRPAANLLPRTTLVKPNEDGAVRIVLAVPCAEPGCHCEARLVLTANIHDLRERDWCA
jgi:hypothetical protein